MSKDSLNTEIGNNSLTPSTDVGQGCQIAAVADSVLCGLVGKIVARLGENCKRLLGDEFDRTEVGYAFRDAFECASWLKYGCRRMARWNDGIIRKETGE